MEIINKNSLKTNYLYFLNLNRFKIYKCRRNKNHNFKKCCYYHNKMDRRRNILIYKYKGIMCDQLKNCIKGDDCEFSHNIIELLYHPLLYKKKFCKKFFSGKICNFKNFCSFAHGEKELRIKLIHKLKQNYNFFLYNFKTEFCPLGKISHDLNYCVYSHNFQDYKRNYLFNKIPIICKNWNVKNNYSSYLEGCINGLKCIYLHGWNELNFHPKNYKTKLCKNKNCSDLICKNIHENQTIIKNKPYFLSNNIRLY